LQQHLRQSGLRERREKSSTGEWQTVEKSFIEFAVSPRQPRRPAFV
jgi:hypothetical protein